MQRKDGSDTTTEAQGGTLANAEANRKKQAIIVTLVVLEQLQTGHGHRERTVRVNPWLLRHVV